MTHPSVRMRAAAAVLAALALLGCAWLAVSHWQAGPFQTGYTLASRGTLHGGEAAVTWPTGNVNPNTADLETLNTLSGVGPVTAQAIVDERGARGPFDYPEDLLLVKGIGPKTLAKFYAQLDFSARVAAP